MNFLLQYGTLVVGSVSDAFESEGTWFGEFQPTHSGHHNSVLEIRIRAFITFCQEWHSRLESGQDPSAAEFDSFHDALTSGLWYAVAPDGVVHRITEAPVFVGSEISWRPA